MTMIKTNEFATRHTADSKFSHFEGTWEQLEALVTEHFAEAAPGYRDGVVLVPVPVDGFFTPVVPLEEGMELRSVFEPRREGEAPFVQTTVKGVGEKSPAKGVSIVLYHHDVLQEDDGASTDAEWEIVSIQARVTEGEEPMHPYTMARNFLHMDGGTKGEFSAEDFAQAILFHFTHGQLS